MELNIEYNYDEVKKALNVYLGGEIDIYNSADVKDKLSELIKLHPTDMHLHCKDLEYIDSTALGALVAVLKKVKSYSGNIYIIDARPSVEKIFHITNLDKAFILEGDKNA